MKRLIKQILPKTFWTRLRLGKHAFFRGLRWSAEALGLTIAQKSDYYSPLPSEFELRKSLSRWDKPSSLAGVPHDLDAIRRRLTSLAARYCREFCELAPYEELQQLGYGPGYPQLDAMILYSMIREVKPKRYLEVGSGLSTYYCSLARDKNAAEGHPTEITCIEPFPFEALHRIKGIKIIKALVQDVPIERFLELEAGDILFIDSSHMVRIDGDVPFLYLEVLPLLKEGVRIHIHDIPFPHNAPFPARYWVLTEDPKSNYWPVYWNEAMLVQAFLALNQHFEIEISCPMLRHFDEPFLRHTIPFYKDITEEPNTFSSLWLHRLSAPEKIVRPPPGSRPS